MPKKRKKYKKRSKGGKLNSGTIYSLFGLALLSGSVLLFASYTRNGSLLSQINDKTGSYFGIFSVLIPLSLLLITFLFIKVKSRFTAPSVIFGFLVFTFSLLGLFRSGSMGDKIYGLTASFIGELFTSVIYFIGAVLGFIVFTNISIQSIFNGIGAFFGKIGEAINEHVIPLLKSKKGSIHNNMKPIVVNGMKNNQPSSLPMSPPPEPKIASNNLPKKTDLVDDLILNKPLHEGVWEYPPISLLSDHHSKAERGDVKKTAGIIERTLQSFGIQARVAEINVGPSVTQYAIVIALGTKLSKITGLGNDLALATEAPTGQVRIEAPIPGRNLVGIEIPNKALELVGLKTMISSAPFQKAKSKLTVPLGLDVSGTPLVTDIAKMPHVLIAGTTGSGKSVLVNAFVSSLLFRASPSEIRFIMIDPKRVELTGYNDIPHLLVPVVVEPAQAVSALKWALKEMERRYIKFAESGVKNLESYNELAGFQAIPFIVIIIDELADLMALAAVEVEDSIARLAQMARATGIHLVLATQRPSVDVITGLIKANIPARIAFSVSSMVDSKVILDTPGAEKLLGKGDMLYIPPDAAKPKRIQGAFVSDQDVKRLVNFIKARGVPVQYTEEVLQQAVNIKGRGMVGGEMGMSGGGNERDPLFENAVRIVCQYDRASSSLLQRRLQIGFNKAARILEQLEAAGVVGPADGAKPREVLIKDADGFISQQQV